MTSSTQQGRVFTYARVSERDAKTGSCSLQWQRDQCDHWLRINERGLWEQLQDNGVSASIPLGERPYGKVLVQSATQPGDVIVVAKFDRIFRSVEDFRARLRVWSAQGVQLVCLAEGIDLTTPTGRMIATMIVAVAEWERETIGERTRAARDTRRKHGLRVSGEARYGWRHVPFGPARIDGSREHRVEPHAQEQYALSLIQTWRGECHSLREIARLLDRACIRPRRGQRWNHASVAGILREIDRHVAPPTDSGEVLATDLSPPPPSPDVSGEAH